MKVVLAGIRLFLFAILLLIFITRYLCIQLFTRDKPTLAVKHRTQFIRLILKVVGLYVKRVSPLPVLDAPYVIMSNHRSYLDPVIALMDYPAMPVAKMEVQSWPLISYGLKLTGILFVQRENQASRHATRQAIEQALLKGESVYICPEGTTHTHPETIEFKPAVFHIAADHGIPILPVSIDYPNQDAAFVGDDTFLPHFVRFFGRWRNYVYISYGKPIKHSDGETLLKECQHTIDSGLKKIQKAM